jgi:hypothetical protein
MKDIVHHARLKNIFEELIVINRPACFDFKNPSLTGRMGVGVETLQYLAFSPEKNGNNYLSLRGFSLLNSKSDFFKAWTKSRHHGVTGLIRLCVRVDGISRFFEKRDDTKAELRRR